MKPIKHAVNKFLHKHKLRDYMRVVSCSEGSKSVCGAVLELRYFSSSMARDSDE